MWILKMGFFYLRLITKGKYVENSSNACTGNAATH